MTYRMTFGNRLSLNGSAILFMHTLRIPVRVKIVEKGSDVPGPTADWTIEIESQSKQMVAVFQKDIVQQLLAYLRARTKKSPDQIQFNVIIELAKAKDFAGANIEDE